MVRRIVLTFLALLLFLPQAAPATGVLASPLPDSQTGGFAGKITDQLTGKPIPVVTVTVCQWVGASCNSRGQGTTNPDGGFEVLGFKPGEYRLCFSHSRYVGECYDDRPVGGDSMRLTIVWDELVTGIDARLLPRGSIRGRATDALTGSGLEGITVTAMAGSGGAWMNVTETVTGADGRYELPLEAGTYRVRFSDPNHARPDRYYAGPDGAPVAVSLGTGQTVEGIDVSLPTPGHIAGRVTRQATGEPLSGIKVSAIDWDWGRVRGQALTDSNGRYDVGALPTGRYNLTFRDEARRYGYAVNGGGTEIYGAPPITVTDGLTTTIDQALVDVGGLVGTAVDAATSAPLEGMWVELRGPADYLGDLTTGADGRIVVEKLDPGVYWGWLGDSSHRYAEISLSPITVTAGMTATVTWPMNELSTSTDPGISQGRVTDAATGAPLAGIKVELEYYYDGSRGRYWYTVAYTNTNAAGEYEFVDPPHAAQLYFSDPAGIYEGQTHSYRDPSPGETVIDDAVLTAYASKYGSITGGVGAGGYMVTVDFIPQGQGGARTAYPDADGGYSMRLLPGTYLVRFNGSYPYEGEYYPDATRPEDAQPVVVRVGETVTINATLTEMGHIAGRVTDSEGRGVAGARVYLQRAPDWSQGAYQAQTDTDGWYISPWLPSGNYHIRVLHDAYDTLVYGGGTDIAKGQDLPVAAGRTTTDVDLALVPRGAVAGHVFDAQTDEPVEGIKVEACGTATTGSDGAFLIPNVQSGWCKVTFSDPQGRYPAHAWNDGTGGPHAGEVQVVSPDTSTVDMRLQRPGRVTGHVVAAASAPGVGGEPVANAEVTLSQGTWKRTVKTDAEGAYDSGLLLNLDTHFTIAFTHASAMYEPVAAQPVEVPHNQVVVQDAAMNIRGEVKGTVTDERTGLPISDVKVQVHRGTTANGPLAYTGGNGGYYLTHLLSGQYTITFTDCCRRYAPLDLAITIEVNTLQEGVDAQLSPWGAIVGRVTDEATGEPLPRAWVVLYRPQGDSWSRLKATVTAGDGTFAFGGLDKGPYRLEFVDPTGGHRAEVYRDAATLAEGMDIYFEPGSDVGADAALAPVGRGEWHGVYLPVVMGK